MVQKAHGTALSIPECRTEKEIRERGKGAVAWEEEGLSERGWDACGGTYGSGAVTH